MKKVKNCANNLLSQNQFSMIAQKLKKDDFGVLQHEPVDDNEEQQSSTMFTNSSSKHAKQQEAKANNGQLHDDRKLYSIKHMSNECVWMTGRSSDESLKWTWDHTSHLFQLPDIDESITKDVHSKGSLSVDKAGKSKCLKLKLPTTSILNSRLVGNSSSLDSSTCEVIFNSSKMVNSFANNLGNLHTEPWYLID